MSHFSGRSRDPILVSHQVDSETALSPLHEMTNQTSLEVQWTLGRWLLKGEGLTRTWGGERIGALAVGAEYVLFDYFSLFLEYLSDSRGSDAPTSYENDIFLGGRVMFDGGSLSVGAFLDTESGNRLGRATLLRSLTDRMAVRLEATWFGGDPLAEPSNALRHDSSLSVALVARL